MNGVELTKEEKENIQEFHRYLPRQLAHIAMFLSSEIGEVESIINNAFDTEKTEEMMNGRLVYAALVQAFVNVATLLKAQTPEGEDC